MRLFSRLCTSAATAVELPGVSDPKLSATFKRTRLTSSLYLHLALERKYPHILKRIETVPKRRWWSPEYLPENSSNPHIRPIQEALRQEALEAPLPPGNLSIGYITARVISLGETSLQKPPVLEQHELDYIQEKGFEPGDVAIWAYCLTESDLNKAIDIIDFINAKRKLPDRAAVPLFVILFLLKRKDLDNKTLQRLVVISWGILRQEQNNVDLRNESVFMLFARLQRQARRHWPQCLPNIASLMTTFMPWQFSERQRLSPDTLSRLTNLYNRALILLSQAARTRPFLNYIFSERAQFLLLERMSQLPQAISINMGGYKALAKVQIAKKKTIQEKEWSVLQSRAFPPYPEPKNQLDVGKGFEFGASRAIRIINHMRYAGYSSPEWERVAQLYAGWEPDGTPSIQTRKIIRPFREISKYPELALWAARVDVARDIREAWHQFLRWEATGHKQQHWVYFSMFRKLVSEQYRQNSSRPAPPNVHFGDTRVTFEPASSPMQRIYLPQEHDSYMDLFRRVRSSGIKAPSGQFLGFLIGYAPSISEGIAIWKASTNAEKKTDIATSAYDENSATYMNDAEFAGLIRLLCRFPVDVSLKQYLSLEEQRNIDSTYRERKEDMGEAQSIIRNQLSKTALFQAIWLMNKRHSEDSRAWQSIFEGVLQMSRNPSIKPYFFGLHRFMHHLVNNMERISIRPDVLMFAPFCHCIEMMGRSARYEISRSNVSTNSHSAAQMKKEAETVTLHGYRILRTLFVGFSTPGVSSEQRMNALSGFNVPPIPSSASLLTEYDVLRYVRALAAFSDYEGIFSLAKWLVANEEDIRASVMELTGGQRRWSSILTTIRLALEDPDKVFTDSHVGTIIPKITPELTELIKSTLMQMKHLRGWANDEDLKLYHTHDEGHPGAMQEAPELESDEYLEDDQDEPETKSIQRRPHGAVKHYKF